MSDQKTTGLTCSYEIGTFKCDPWRGHPIVCGQKNGTQKDPRQERYDVGLCPRHMSMIREDNDDS